MKVTLANRAAPLSLDGCSLKQDAWHLPDRDVPIFRILDEKGRPVGAIPLKRIVSIST